MSTNLVSIAQQFTGLPMDALIGGPLNAAADANAKMAISQTKFILDTCFVRKGEENEVSYQPVLVKMELERTFVQEDETIEKVTTTFNLPLLTIMPINSLGVDSVDVNFDMEVNSCYSEENSKEKMQAKQRMLTWKQKLDLGYSQQPSKVWSAMIAILPVKKSTLCEE
ncbi:DUF2589 domain-containing protein [Myroides sp. mNGS23_01]|nr:DUF2589 domain-containing protein [Myroides sp. mNGS23_01]WHT39081.1 DUF2589 domain-containing protein [Myroides sp. mNGS23_01]